MAKKFKLKKGDEVIVLTGKDKGKTGKIIKMIPTKEKAIVSDINKYKKNQKPNNNEPGGIVEKEAPIHISNLSLTTAEGVPTRTGFRVEDGNKVRFAKKNNEEV